MLRFAILVVCLASVASLLSDAPKREMTNIELDAFMAAEEKLMERADLTPRITTASIQLKVVFQASDSIISATNPDEMSDEDLQKYFTSLKMKEAMGLVAAVLNSLKPSSVTVQTCSPTTGYERRGLKRNSFLQQMLTSGGWKGTSTWSTQVPEKPFAANFLMTDAFSVDRARELVARRREAEDKRIRDEEQAEQNREAAEKLRRDGAAAEARRVAVELEKTKPRRAREALAALFGGVLDIKQFVTDGENHAISHVIRMNANRPTKFESKSTTWCDMEEPIFQNCRENKRLLPPDLAAVIKILNSIPDLKSVQVQAYVQAYSADGQQLDFGGDTATNLGTRRINLVTNILNVQMHKSKSKPKFIVEPVAKIELTGGVGKSRVMGISFVLPAGFHLWDCDIPSFKTAMQR